MMIELKDAKVEVGCTVRVVLNEDMRKHSDAGEVDGLVGTVKVEHSGKKWLLAVEFPEYWDGHNCDGNCKSPHGWWVYEWNLEVIA